MGRPYAEVPSVSRPIVRANVMLRKFVVWLLCFAVILGAYLLYNRWDSTPRLGRGRLPQLPAVQADSNCQSGQVSGVGVGKVTDARFEVRDPKTGRIAYIFGFSKLLHKQARQWDVRKPYLKLFRDDFNCVVTAATGSVTVEQVGRNVTPRDARLAGDVRIRILPTGAGRSQGFVVLLDDVAFFSEQSRFSSGGPVRFISQTAELTGRGLELVYNEQAGRVEYLYISNLDLLRLSAKDTRLLPTGPRPAEPAGQKTKGVGSPPDDKPSTGGECYRLTFGRDVVADGRRQWVLARESLAINDILWVKAPAEAPQPAAPTTNGTSAVNEPVEQTQPDRWDPNEQWTGRPVYDVNVTCRGGLLFAPMDSKLTIDDFERRGGGLGVASGPVAKPPGKATTLIAQAIDYSLADGRTVAAGPIELVFHPNDVAWPAHGRDRNAPVTVTAEEQASFLPDSQKVVLEGNVNCSMLRQDAGVLRQYTLSSQRLDLELVGAGSAEPNGSGAALKHLTASGGTVRLSAVSRAGEKLLDGFELKCRSFDYDPAEQVCVAVGPGLIKAHSADVAEANAPASPLGLDRPYWATVENFETLKFLVADSKIVAAAPAGEVLAITYIPIIDGRYGRVARASAAHISAVLGKTDRKRTCLSHLTAAGGVTYEDADNQFAGAVLTYDADTATVSVRGDAARPCLLNGALVDGLEYNLRTGRVKAEASTPGTL